WEGANLHRAQVHRANTATDSLCIDDRRKKLPALKFADAAFGFVSADLLIECIEQLLAGCGSGECGAVIERSAKTTEIQQTFRRAVEWHAHAIKQVDNAGRCLAHVFYRRLVSQEIAAVNGVVEVLPGSVAFAFQVLRCVNSTLCAD